MINRKHYHSISLKLTDEELQLWNTKHEASGLSKTDYLMQAIRDSEVRIYSVADDIAPLIHEIRKIGTNLNQLAYYSKKPTEPKSSQPTTQEPKQKTAFFTREKLKADAERIRREYERSHKAQKQAPFPELDAIETRVREMAEEIGVSSVDAQRDERVLLLVTATLKMCQLLKNYSTAINAEIQRLSEHQMQNLSLQEQYAKSVRTEVADSVYSIYHQVKAQEKEAINELMQYVQANSDQMEKDITACAGKVKSATDFHGTGTQL